MQLFHLISRRSAARLAGVLLLGIQLAGCARVPKSLLTGAWAPAPDSAAGDPVAVLKGEARASVAANTGLSAAESRSATTEKLAAGAGTAPTAAERPVEIGNVFAAFVGRNKPDGGLMSDPFLSREESRVTAASAEQPRPGLEARFASPSAAWAGASPSGPSDGGNPFEHPGVSQHSGRNQFVGGIDSQLERLRAAMQEDAQAFPPPELGDARTQQLQLQVQSMLARAQREAASGHLTAAYQTARSAAGLAREHRLELPRGQMTPDELASELRRQIEGVLQDADSQANRETPGWMPEFAQGLAESAGAPGTQGRAPIQQGGESLAAPAVEDVRAAAAAQETGTAGIEQEFPWAAGTRNTPATVTHNSLKDNRPERAPSDDTAFRTVEYVPPPPVPLPVAKPDRESHLEPRVAPDRADISVTDSGVLDRQQPGLPVELDGGIIPVEASVTNHSTTSAAKVDQLAVIVPKGRGGAGAAIAGPVPQQTEAVVTANTARDLTAMSPPAHEATVQVPEIPPSEPFQAYRRSDASAPAAIAGAGAPPPPLAAVLPMGPRPAAAPWAHIEEEPPAPPPREHLTPAPPQPLSSLRFDEAGARPADGRSDGVSFPVAFGFALAAAVGIGLAVRRRSGASAG